METPQPRNRDLLDLLLSNRIGRTLTALAIFTVGAEAAYNFVKGVRDGFVAGAHQPCPVETQK